MFFVLQVFRIYIASMFGYLLHNVMVSSNIYNVAGLARFKSNDLNH